MENLIPYKIHYLHDGKPEHFYTNATAFSESDAIRMATRHAGEGPEYWIPIGLPRESILKIADKLGITKVRWNKAG